MAWQIGYAVNKHRAGRAPEGSGAPVGTEYQWYVVAHQNVAKQSANDYTTSLTGFKFKVAPPDLMPRAVLALTAILLLSDRAERSRQPVTRG